MSESNVAKIDTSWIVVAMQNLFSVIGDARLSTVIDNPCSAYALADSPDQHAVAGLGHVMMGKA